MVVASFSSIIISLMKLIGQISDVSHTIAVLGLLIYTNYVELASF